MSKHEISDTELDLLLDATTAPPPVPDAPARLLARLAERESEAAGNVVPFRRPAAPVEQRSRLGWLAGLPLAASLAFGIYLGSADADTNLLTNYAQAFLGSTASEDPLTGIDDVEGLSEEDFS